VFAQELVSKRLVQVVSNAAPPHTPTEVEEPEGQTEKGTWGGTQLALTDMYSRIERRYVVWVFVTSPLHRRLRRRFASLYHPALTLLTVTLANALLYYALDQTCSFSLRRY